MKHLQLISRSRNNTRLMEVILRCKSAHSVPWPIVLARYHNNNINIANMISMAKRNLETTSFVSCPFRATYKYSIWLDRIRSSFYRKSKLDVDDMEQSIFWSINNVKKNFIEPIPSMKRKYQGWKARKMMEMSMLFNLNRFIKRKPYSIFRFAKCKTSNFKTEEESIYKQATEAEITQDWRG